MMHQDFVVRPIRETDLPALIEIAGQLGPGFTSLPNDIKILETKVACSIESFAEKIDKVERFYLFVMENLKNKKIVGTSAITASVAYPWPFYNFKLSILGQYSEALKKYRESKILYLVSDYQNAAELGALFLEPTYRGGGQGQFISRTRCLFIAEFPTLFPEVLIAEMRGICDQNGVSPFWEGLGKHFFDMDFQTADYIRATRGNLFLSELMPRHPIYVDLLPESAKHVIGRAHERSMPAMHVLNKEGFQYKNYVDILNGGPTIEIARDDLKSLRESKTIVIKTCQKKLETKETWLLSNRSMDYRSALGAIELTEQGEGILEESTAKALNVSVGDSIRYCYVR